MPIAHEEVKETVEEDPLARPEQGRSMSVVSPGRFRARYPPGICARLGSVVFLFEHMVVLLWRQVPTKFWYLVSRL